MTDTASKGALGPWMSLSLVIGTMIGGGIFVLQSSLAPLGWNAILAWVISGAGAITLAMAFRFLMDGTGQGIQHNIERVLGEGLGFIAIWAYWFAGIPSMAGLSLAGSTMLLGVVAPDAGQFWQLLWAIVIVWLLVGVNCLGTRSAGRFQLVSVLIKLVPLLLVIGLAAWFVSGPREAAPLADTPITFDNLSLAVALTLFALLGFEVATVPVNKVRDPRRNIAIALLGGTGFVLLLYLLTSAGLALIMPWQELAASPTPYNDAIGSVLGTGAATLVAICIAISVIGCTNGVMLLSGELLYSMALRKEMPSSLKVLNKNGVSARGLVVSGVLTSLMLLLNTSRGAVDVYQFFVLLTSGTALVLYGTVLVAVFKESRSFARLLVLLPAGGFVAFATYGTGLESMLWLVALLIAGWAVRWVVRRVA